MRAIEKQTGGQLDDIPFRDELSWRNELKTLNKLSLEILGEIKVLESIHRINIGKGINLSNEIRNFEINLIKIALLHSGGSQLRSAHLLGISKATLNSKMKRYNLVRPASLKDSF